MAKTIASVSVWVIVTSTWVTPSISARVLSGAEEVHRRLAPACDFDVGPPDALVSRAHRLHDRFFASKSRGESAAGLGKPVGVLAFMLGEASLCESRVLGEHLFDPTDVCQVDSQSDDLHGCHPTGHGSSVIRHPSSVIRHPSSVIRHPSSVIRHPSSVKTRPLQPGAQGAEPGSRERSMQQATGHQPPAASKTRPRVGKPKGRSMHVAPTKRRTSPPPTPNPTPAPRQLAHKRPVHAVHFAH